MRPLLLWGVKAAMQSKDLGILNPWLRNIRDVYRTYRDELDTFINEDDKYNRLIELNVQEQCLNLIKTAAVQRAHKEWGLEVHGWVFDVKPANSRTCTLISKIAGENNGDIQNTMMRLIVF